MDKNWLLELAYDEWVAVPIAGSRPSARYKHTAAVADEKLYIVGGSRNGRYLSDVQVFDLRYFSWSNLKLQSDPKPQNVEDGNSEEVLPAISGHAMIKWGQKLLLLGGNTKRSSDKIIVRFIDLETHVCGIMETFGKVPVDRAGHSATLVGSRIIIFGGEDRKRRLFNDVHILDLETMTWDALDLAQTPPAPRFDHTAAVHAENYLLVFGGCSHSVFFNDLHILDLQAMEWSQPQTNDSVTHRAGHTGVTIDENWYIVGGGDNRNGCSVTIVLNMSKLVWSALARVNQRDFLASEGLSVCSATIDGERYLTAFGGYNGKYSNEIFVMRLKPRDSSRPKIFQSPAAAAAAASVTAAYALAKTEKLDVTAIEGSNGINAEEEMQNNIFRLDQRVSINAEEEAKAKLQLSLAQVRSENSRLQEEIDEVNNTHAELSKELQSVQGQLLVERSRCFKLEAQIVELQKMLESMPSIENEVQILRRQKSAMERDMELASSVQRQGSGSVWRWIGGGT